MLKSFLKNAFIKEIFGSKNSETNLFWQDKVSEKFLL